MSEQVILDTRLLDELIEHSENMVDQAIRATAFEVAAIATSLAAVDTGAMRASIFVRTSDSNGFDQAKMEAEAMNPGSSAHDPTPTGSIKKGTAMIAPGMEYSAFVEFGLGQPAQPFLTPAMEKAEGAFVKYLKETFLDPDGELKNG